MDGGKSKSSKAEASRRTQCPPSPATTRDHGSNPHCIQAQPSIHAQQSTAIQTNGQVQNGTTLLGLPPECMQIVCKHLEGNQSKIAAMRTCLALQSAVLEACMVLMYVQFPQARWDSQRRQSREERIHQTQVRWEKQAKMLQQAKGVHLKLQCVVDDSLGSDGWEVQGASDMQQWLGEMFQRCKGPLLSVCKLRVKGDLGAQGTLSSWLSIFCPNVTDLKANTYELCSQRYGIRQVAARVYNIELVESIELVGIDDDHLLALMGAPLLKSVTCLYVDLEHNHADRTCHWDKLHITGHIELYNVVDLPYTGIAHLMLGRSDRPLSLELAHSSDCVQHHNDAQNIRDACEHLTKYGKVTLGLGRAIKLHCGGVNAVDAAVALPLLQYAQPNMLMISGLAVSLLFLNSLNEAMPQSVKKVGFHDVFWEEGVLEQVLPLLPLHVNSFTFTHDNESVCWEDIQTASAHATRPVEVLVPTLHSKARQDRNPQNLPYHVVRRAEKELAGKWPGVLQAMQNHGHQNFSVKKVMSIFD